MSPLRSRRRGAPRRGATLVLIAVMSTALVSVGALVINWAYIELAHTQLRSAADASAKAALVTLSQTQSQAQARTVARQIAQQFTVAGQTLLISDTDVEFGNSQADGAGGYTFAAGAQPLNCARVVARCGPGSATASASVMFGNLLNTDEFALDKRAVAGRFDHDVCVVVDRSASMAWDLTGSDFSYPDEYNNDSTLQNYFRPPHPTGSRWAKLLDALHVFRDVVERRDLNAKIGLVSYASDYTFGNFSSDRVTQDQYLSFDTSRFVAAAENVSLAPIIGDTNITAGIENGRSVLTRTADQRLTANRTMILLSDGKWTEGGNPTAQAQAALADRITIHTVSFGEGVDTALMQLIADTTGGRYYRATTGEELEQAFETIAEELPAVLIE